MLLVDPQETWLRHQQTRGRSRLTDFYPNRQIYAEADMDRDSGSNVHPYARPLHEAIVKAHASPGQRTGSLGPTTEDPFSATTFSRRLIHAAWADFHWREEFEFRDLVLDDETAHHLYQGNTALMPLESGVDARTVEKYERLMETRNDDKRWRLYLNSIMWSCRAGTPTSSGMVEKDQRLWEKTRRKADKDGSRDC